MVFSAVRPAPVGKNTSACSSKCEWCMFNQDRSRLEKVKQNESHFSIRKMKLRVKYKQADTELRLAIKRGFKLLDLDDNNSSKKITLTLSIGWLREPIQ